MSHTLSVQEVLEALQLDSISIHNRLVYLDNNPEEYPADQLEAKQLYQAELDNNEYLINNL